MNFEQFLASPLRNEWLKEDGLNIYVRKSVYRGLYDLANISAPKMGKGAYTRFLDRYDSTYPFMIENVLQERLADFHRRRGWVELPCPYDVPSFLSPLAVERGLGPIHRALR